MKWVSWQSRGSVNQDWQEEGKQVCSRGSGIRLKEVPAESSVVKRIGHLLVYQCWMIKILPKKQRRRNDEVCTVYVRRQLGMIHKLWV